MLVWVCTFGFGFNLVLVFVIETLRFVLWEGMCCKIVGVWLEDLVGLVVF